ncbi:MAG TPA: hypothetical protein VKY86_18545 [Promicromonospora sp.]|nr:hypothetical protein [Promicromonospora sp.]
MPPCSTPRATTARAACSGWSTSSTKRWRAGALRGTGQALQWRADDTGDAWHVERRPEGAVWRAGTGPADVTVTGPAGPLLLALTRRLPLEDAGLRVDGDAALVRHWLDHTAHVAD